MRVDEAIVKLQSILDVDPNAEIEVRTGHGSCEKVDMSMELLVLDGSTDDSDAVRVIAVIEGLAGK